MITTSRQLGVLLEALVGDFLNVIEEERALGGHTLHIRVLVLHDAGHHGVIHVPEHGDSPACLTVDDLLSRCRDTR